MACKGKCQSPKLITEYNIKPQLGCQRSYADHWKRCIKCEISLISKGLFCPCCNGRLRVKIRSNQGITGHRNKTQIKLGIKRI